MIEYLKQFDITTEEVNDIKNHLNNEIVTNLEIMQQNVIEILAFLKDFGVTNFINIIKYRPDLCFKDKQNLESKINEADKELLLFIFNNNIDDLISFNI